MGILQEAAKAILRDELTEIRSDYGVLAQNSENLRETITELQLQLEDAGWTRLSGYAIDQFNRESLGRIAELSRVLYLKNPLIQRGANVKRLYVWGQSVNVEAEDPDINAVIQDFIDDRRNRLELTSHQARMLKEIDLQVDGNLFLVLFTNPSTGAVKLASIPFSQMQDIISNPEDAKEPWYYLRSWMEKIQTGGKHYNVGVKMDKKAYYPDWQYNPVAVKSNVMGGTEVRWDGLIYHVKVGAFSDWTWGVSEHYAAQDWAKAYKEFLEDWASIVRSYRRFAWRFSGAKSKGEIAAIKSKMHTTIGTGTTETNPPPVTGAAAVLLEGRDLQPIRTAGATVAAEDGRRLLLMVAAAEGLPECYAEDTEVLTERGFMRHDEWREGIRIAAYNPETNLLEWHHPKALRTYRYDGGMIHFRNQQTDILVTPNHRMWTAPKVQWELMPATEKVAVGAYGPGGRQRVADGAPPMVDRSWRIETAEHILDNPRDAGWRFRNGLEWAEPRSRIIDTPVGQRDAESWARFIGYWLSEGWATASVCKSGEYRKDKTPIMRTFRRVMLAQREGAILEDMRVTLHSLDIHFHEVVASSGVVNLVVNHKGLWEYLRESCGENSHSKGIPHELLYGDRRIRQALYKALMDGDGGRSGGSWRYSTVSKALADDMQILASSLGYGASISLDNTSDRVHPIYRVWIRTRITGESRLSTRQVKRVAYAGLVHCFGVEHGLYVTRRNGKIAIQGNTFFGDVSVGTLATATSMDRPTELAMKDRQMLWADIHRDLFNFVLLQDMKAPSGQLHKLGRYVKERVNGKWLEWVEWRDDVDPSVSISFPSLLERDVVASVEAITTGATLGGMPSANTIPKRELSRMILTELGAEDVDEMLEVLEEEEAERLARAPEVVTAPESFTPEEPMIAAARELRDGLEKLVKDYAKPI